MTGMGEEVYTAPGGADHFPGVGEMVEAAAKARWEQWRAEWTAINPSEAPPVWGDVPPEAQAASLRCERAALESLGVPLSVLAAIRAGTWRAVPEEPTREQIDAMCDAPLHPTVFPMYRAALKAAPKTPEE